VEVEHLTAIFEYQTAPAKTNVEALAGAVERLTQTTVVGGKAVEDYDSKTQKSGEGSKKAKVSADDLAGAVGSNLTPKLTQASAEVGKFEGAIDRTSRGAIQGMSNMLGNLLRQIPVIGQPLAGITQNWLRFATTSHDTTQKVVKDAKTMEDAYKAFAASLKNAIMTKDDEKKGLFGELLDDPLTKIQKYRGGSASNYRTREREVATPLARDTGAAFDKFVDSFSKLGSAEERTQVATQLFGKEAQSLLPVLEGAAAGTEEAAVGATGMGAAFLAVAAPIAIVLAAVVLLGAGFVAVESQLFSLAKGAADFSAKFDDVSKKTRLTNETISTLSAGAKLVGVDFGSLSNGLVEFTRNIDLANGGAKDQSKLIKELNIDTSNQEKALSTAFIALNKLPDGYKKNALAAKLFGSDADGMLKVIQKSGGSLENFKQQLEGYGVVVGGDAVAQSKRFNDQLALLDLRWEGLKRQMGQSAMPEMTKQMELLSKALEGTGPGLSLIVGGLAKITTATIGVIEQMFHLVAILKLVGAMSADTDTSPTPKSFSYADPSSRASTAQTEDQTRAERDRFAKEAVLYANDKQPKGRKEHDPIDNLKQQLDTLREQFRQFDADTIDKTESVKTLTNLLGLLTDKTREQVAGNINGLETDQAILAVLAALTGKRKEQAQALVDQINAQATLNQTKKDAKTVEEFLNKELETARKRQFELQFSLKEGATNTEKFEQRLKEFAATHQGANDILEASPSLINLVREAFAQADKDEAPKKLADQVDKYVESLQRLHEQTSNTLSGLDRKSDTHFDKAVDETIDKGKEIGLTAADGQKLKALSSFLNDGISETQTSKLAKIDAVLQNIFSGKNIDPEKFAKMRAEIEQTLLLASQVDTRTTFQKNADLLSKTIDTLNGKFRERGEITEEERIRTETLTGALKDLAQADKDAAIAAAIEADARRSAIDAKKEEEREAKKIESERLKRAHDQASALAGIIHDTITAAFSDGWKGVLQSFLHLLDEMLMKFLESQLLRAFSNVGAGGGGASGGGFWSTLLNGVIGIFTGGLGGGHSGGAIDPGTGGSFRPRALAGGGSFDAGELLMVGEHEPEMMIPDRPGRVLNGKQMRDAMGGGDDTYITYNTVNQTIHAPRNVVAPKSARQAAEQASGALTRFGRR
jgi:hypothetical protein